jgi:DNA polymerase phi
MVFQTDGDISLWNDILDLLCHLAKSVPWIREECGLVLCDTIKTLAALPFCPLFIQSCLDKLQTLGLLRSPEGVAIWLTVQKDIPTFTNFPKDVWIGDSPIDPRNRRDLSNAMREHYEASPESTKDLDNSGFWQQSVHFTWTIVLQQGMNENPDEFRDLWMGLVDGESSSTWNNKVT